MATRERIKVCWEAKVTGLAKCVCDYQSHRAGAKAGVQMITITNHDKPWPCLHFSHTETVVSMCVAQNQDHRKFVLWLTRPI